ncbi:MAG: sulfite exporter TauE/SafE family protein [Pseudomonadota bacterium]
MIDLLPILLACIGLGLLAGLLSGLLGVGGGFTTVPALNFLLPFAAVPSQHLMHVAIATSLSMMIANTVTAAWWRWRAGHLDLSLTGLLAIPVALGAVAGAVFADSLADWVLRWGFIGFVALVLIRSLYRRIRPKPQTQAPPPDAAADLPAAPIWFPYFFVTGITGAMAGGGAATLALPFLVARRYAIGQAAGQAAALSAIIGVAAAFTYAGVGGDAADLPPWTLGYLYLPALAGLIIGGQLGVPRGVALARRLSEAQQRAVFFAFLSVVLTAMVAKAVSS